MEQLKTEKLTEFGQTEFKEETKGLKTLKLFKKNNSQGLKLISPAKIKLKTSSTQSSTAKNKKVVATERNNPCQNLECQSTVDNEETSRDNPCESCSMNEEFILLLQKEIKRLQNITNDLSYQLIMNGQKPQIKESERAPIDLSINPLRRREQRSKLSDNRTIPSKILDRAKTGSSCENVSNTSTQADVARPSSGFRIRDQNGISKYSTVDLSKEEAPAIAVDKGPNKVEKYKQEIDFVKKIGKESVKAIGKPQFKEKPLIKKLSIGKKSKNKNNLMLPPLEQQEGDG
ncbi:unnamed protein product [Moneuplotes crassus]|uniref:Uncharacterized protein n=1 Tax=Euplotes crassus TaxID=5936 RepID=A0AAD1URG1_EUPCR|nr:unnamed protein product [Moneuplotes crassus]